MAAQQVRVVLVDDHPAILEAVSAAVRGAPDLVLAGTARSLDGARALLDGPGATACDVIVSDVQLAGEAEGLRILEAAGSNGPAVLLLSSFDQPPLIRTAFERGAAGYLLKTSEVTEILDAIRTVRSEVARRSPPRCCARSGPPRDARPTARSRCSRSSAAGPRNDEVGVQLGVTEKTVESHLRRLFDRYGVLSRTELAVLALREGSGDGEGQGMSDAGVTGSVTVPPPAHSRVRVTTALKLATLHDRGPRRGVARTARPRTRSACRHRTRRTGSPTCGPSPR